MMKEEFERIAGYEVTWDDYNNIIEPMYSATSLSKQEFVKCIDKKRFALPTKQELLKKMRKIAKHLKDICGHWEDYDARHELEDIARQYAERFHGFNQEETESYFYFQSEYEFPAIGRGCTYPAKLIIGNRRFETSVTLVND